MFALKKVSHYVNSIVKILNNQLHGTDILQKFAKENDLNLVIKGQTLKFPFVWLRDNCQCEQCFHGTAKSRILDWSNFDLNIKPQDVVENENGLHITWIDGHKSQYNFDWLKFRSFNTENQKNYNETIYKPEKIPWHGDDFEKVCTKHDYNEILKSDEALYNWLHIFSIYGVSLIENTPQSDKSLDKIVDKIGFTKRTHYGVKFIVQHVANTSNVAYLTSNLQMHVDLPYYEYAPGVNLLHCLVQTESKGGENLLSDCHYVAEYMRDHHEEQYKLLTDVEVEWSDIGVEDGNEFFKLHRSPIISLNKHGQINRISFSVPQRNSHFPGDINTVAPWYEAYELFLKLNHKFSAKFKTKAGDILVFDNIRLLHGRNAYEDNANNVRKLIGAYVDWDEIYSRLRCLKVKKGNIKGI